MGDLAEAERVYSVALEHRPQLDRARTARAYVRRALGFRRDAAVDLLGPEPSPASLQVLAGWHEEDGQTPAELAVWRRLAVLAEASQDLTLQKEARRMIRALVILVGSADPAASPVDPIGPRKLVAVLTKTWWPAPASRR